MKYVFLTSALIVILTGLVILWFYPAANAPENVTGSSATSTGSFPSTDGSTGSQTSVGSMDIAASDNTPISVRNFLSDSDVSIYPAPGYYALGPYSGSIAYKISYQSSSKLFTVSLLSEPIGTARIQAQQYLMTKLGITQTDMCRLKYTLSVPVSVNETYASRNLLFSFCPGAVTLPQ